MTIRRPLAWTPVFPIALGLLALLDSHAVNGLGPMLRPRIQPPLTVVGMPLSAEFRSVIVKKGGSSQTQGRVINGRFYRNAQGDTRTEYYANESRETVAILKMWYADRHESVLVDIRAGAIHRIKNPDDPRAQSWLPVGRWTFEKTNDQKIMCGLLCDRVLIRPVPRDAKTEVASLGEAWVSFEWGLVTSDVEESQDQESRWEIISVQKGDPDPSIFELHLPPDIVESSPSP